MKVHYRLIVTASGVTCSCPNSPSTSTTAHHSSPSTPPPAPSYSTSALSTHPSPPSPATPSPNPHSASPTTPSASPMNLSTPASPSPSPHSHHTSSSPYPTHKIEIPSHPTNHDELPSVFSNLPPTFYSRLHSLYPSPKLVLIHLICSQLNHLKYSPPDPVGPVSSLFLIINPVFDSHPKLLLFLINNAPLCPIASFLQLIKVS